MPRHENPYKSWFNGIYSRLEECSEMKELENGIHEVVGSIPSGSTIFIADPHVLKNAGA
jgi:hypothetical protein